MDTVITFERFWVDYHYTNRQNKLNKSATRKLWDNINCMGKKRQLMDIEKSELNCYEYLKGRV